jgi:hypothetical protein
MTWSPLLSALGFCVSAIERLLRLSLPLIPELTSSSNSTYVESTVQNLPWSNSYDRISISLFPTSHFSLYKYSTLQISKTLIFHTCPLSMNGYDHLVISDFASFTLSLANILICEILKDPHD